jgi:dihydrofolate reductase
MRKITTATFVSLDGVMQAPGGPQEDPVGGFEYGGWIVDKWDDVMGAYLSESFGKPFDLLLGRKTYDIFAAHWPYQPEGDSIAPIFNRVRKYVATRNPGLKLAWENSETLGGDVVEALRELTKQDGPDLLVQGSTDLLRTVLNHDLVDEFSLMIFPLVLGKGKKLFSEEAAPGQFEMIDHKTSSTGVVIARYRRAGAVTAGSFVPENPSEAELERRRNLT